MKVSRRRGCGVFRFLWPWEWDEPDGDKPSEAEDLTDTLWLPDWRGFHVILMTLKEKGHVQTDKQELLVGWLVSWWRKAGEKLRRHVIQKKDECQGRGTWSVYDSKHDQRMISHMISAIKSRDHYMIVMWSVHAQSRYQCMISHVISAWSVTGLVYDHPRDQYIQI